MSAQLSVIAADDEEVEALRAQLKELLSDKELHIETKSFLALVYPSNGEVSSYQLNDLAEKIGQCFGIPAGQVWQDIAAWHSGNYDVWQLHKRPLLQALFEDRPFRLLGFYLQEAGTEGKAAVRIEGIMKVTPSMLKAMLLATAR
jgi:hypothetical protein